MAAEQPAAETDWSSVSFVISSADRTTVFQRLMDSPATPSSIAEDTGMAISHVSRALSALRDEGMVDLLVEEERRKGRIYGLDDEARDLADRIEEVA